MDKVYFLVNYWSCHARVLNWAILENICQVEPAQYVNFLYWASSTGRIFSRLWHDSSQISLEGAPMKSSPMNCLSSRTHQTWPRISLCAKCYEGILNVDNFRGEGHYMLTKQEKRFVCQPTESFADKVRQDLMSGCIQLRPM